MPRPLYLRGIGIVMVAAAFILTHEALGPWPGVTEANARRIRKGMTWVEVTEILGPHPFGRKYPGSPGGDSLTAWAGRDGEVYLHFTEDGLVAYSEWRPNGHRIFTFDPTESPRDRARHAASVAQVVEEQVGRLRGETGRDGAGVAVERRR